MRLVRDWHRGAAERAAEELKGADAPRLLRWALDEFPEGHLVLASSFGPEDIVLLDLFEEIGRFPRVVTLDTGRLFQETHELAESARARWGLKVETYFPDAGRAQELVDRHGPNPFYRSVELRRLCCQIRKLEPLRRALLGAMAWVTGLRREQSPERSDVPKVGWDEEFGLVKLNPLADWTSAQVWDRIRAKNLPYNRLHDAGYPSVGCAPCTRAVKPGEDFRAGRWWWENGPRECGLHRPGEPAS